MDVGAVVGTFTTRFLGLFIEAASFLMLGSLLAGLLEVFLTKEDVLKLVPRNTFLALLAGSFLGFLFPVCECGVVPVTRRLYQKGLPPAVGITFLLAAPVMNPIVFATTFAAFGWGPVLIGRYVITWITSMVIGLIFSFQTKPQKLLQPSSFGLISGGSQEAVIPLLPARPQLLPGLKQAAKYASDDFFDMARFLVIGSLLATIVQTFVPQDAIRTLATNPANSVFVMAGLAFILSVCSTVDAFLALSFARTFTTGSILTFLTFGPMVDMKSATMYMGIYRRRTVLYMMLLPFLITTLIGIWLNLNVSF